MSSSKLLGGLCAAGVVLLATVTGAYAEEATDFVPTTELSDELVDEMVADALNELDAAAEAGAATEAAEVWALDGAPVSDEVSDPAVDLSAISGEAVDVAPYVATDDVEQSDPIEMAGTVISGAPAIDSEGNRGHIHTVVSGDTLWHISKAYLQTPWVWPSIWSDNKQDIANPHRIDPGDRIWISPTEIRRVTADEADDMIAAWEPAAPVEMLAEEPEPVLEEYVAPAAPSDGEMLADTMPAPAETLGSIRINGRGNMSFVTAEQMDAATAIVESPSPRRLLTQTDVVYLGLGNGETKVGDRYTIFRDADEVRDPSSNRLLGYHMQILGVAQVTNPGPETSVAKIVSAVSEMERGDMVIRRGYFPSEVGLTRAPADLEGRVIYLPSQRSQVAQSDYLYINRGTIHGVEVGNSLEVFEYGRLAEDDVNSTYVQTPDWRVGKLVVVSTEPETSVVYVLGASREIEIGDVVRSADRELARR